MGLDLSALDQAFGDDNAAPADQPPRAPLHRFVEDNIRIDTEEDPDEFEKFVEDVRLHGVLQAVVCVRLPDGRLKIRFGHWRYRASVRLGLPDLPYLVTEDPRQFSSYAQFSENSRRHGMTPLETAVFIEKRMEEGEKKARIAQNMGIDPAAITHHLALVNDPPAFIMELYLSRRCRTAQYLYELRKLHGVAPDLVEERCRVAAKVDRAFVDATAAAVNAATATPPAAPAPGSAPSAGASGEPAQASAPGNPAGESPSGGGTEPPVQQVPPHNPAIEAQRAGKSPSADESRLKKPLLLGTYNSRPVMVLLTQRPSAVGMVAIRYEDGSGDEEVTIGDVTLTMLTESSTS